MKNAFAGNLESNDSNPNAGIQKVGYFILTVLGFSFWFWMAVPFASHRESYSWLAAVHAESLSHQFSFGLSSTYRPVSQVVTRLGFLILDPRVFPTSPLRQAFLQGFIYAMFVLAWWLIYSAAAQKRLFALLACATGGVFFSGYVHLFHIYGMFYVAVMLMFGALLLFHASDNFDKHEVWLTVVATVLAFWHPFATALFAGFYWGFYLDTFRQRSRAQHVQALTGLLACTTAIAALVVFFPRTHMPLDAKLFGFLVSYHTNEVNIATSIVAFLLTQIVVFSMGLSPRLRLAGFLFVSALSIVFFLKSLPLLLLWMCAVLIKLLLSRCWSLFFLALTAALLPFGGGIGTPMHALFAIIVATYVTSMEWSGAEKALSFFQPRYVMAMIAASAIVVLMVRVGIEVPIVTSTAKPLLTERERTYQLENILAWLHSSDYCGYEIAFVENAGNPVDSVESAITRRNRPPSTLEDVQYFWNTAMRCQKGQPSNQVGTAYVAFGGPVVLPNSKLVFEVGGRYAGEATVWIGDSDKVAGVPYSFAEKIR
jgi:hypothetical protein